MSNTSDKYRTKLVRVLNSFFVRSDHAVQILSCFDAAVSSARMHEFDRIFAEMKKISERPGRSARGKTVSP